MGQSLSVPHNEPDGAFTHQPSGSQVTVLHESGVLHHRLQEQGLTADYPIAYSIGYGNVGRSFLIELGGHLFQSPASFYSQRSEWGVSPGYEHQKVLDFSRPITSDCLFCHAGSVNKAGSSTALAALSCERCHGPSENHLRDPFPGSIVNPAKLPVRKRDSVCEQCHLEGATVILNPGKYWWDFQAGEILEQTETHYVYRDAPFAAVSHAEQLALSACLRGSGGKLWCGTCHDPHGEPADRKVQIRGICQSCHSTSQLASFHRPEQIDCVACHMPRRQALDISHAAVTDHRIRRWPAAPVPVPAGEPPVVAWQPAEPPFAARNLGLALFHTAKLKMSGGEFAQAFSVLSKLPSSENDAEVSAAKGYMLLGSGQPVPAAKLFARAAGQVPANAEFWLDLGVAQSAAGDTKSALSSLRASIEADPYDYRPYKALSALYERLHQPAQASAVIEEFLHLVPQSILMRLRQ